MVLMIVEALLIVFLLAQGIDPYLHWRLSNVCLRGRVSLSEHFEVKCKCR